MWVESEVREKLISLARGNTARQHIEMKTTTTEKSEIGSEGKSQNVIEVKLAARAAPSAREQQSYLMIIGLHESRRDDRDEELRCEPTRAAKRRRRRRRMVWWPGKMAPIVLLMMIVMFQQQTCCSASSLADYDGKSSVMFCLCLHAMPSAVSRTDRM